MKRSIQWQIILTLIFGIAQLVCNIELLAKPTRCRPSNVHVYAENQLDAQFVCKATSETLSFLMQAGLDIQKTFNIHLTDGFKRSLQQKSYLGIYDHRVHEIHVLSYECCKRLYKGECFCGLKLSRDLHTSFIVHEIAHALTIGHLQNKIGCVAAAEYIAYTTQFSLMPKKLRQKILTRITNEGFTDEVEITSLFHDLNPSVFAVKAYRHFIRPENGKNFYIKLITGQYILDRED